MKRATETGLTVHHRMMTLDQNNSQQLSGRLRHQTIPPVVEISPARNAQCIVHSGSLNKTPGNARG